MLSKNKELDSQLNSLNLSLSSVYDSLIATFLKDSRFTSKEEEKVFLLKLLDNNRVVTMPLYCGLTHGWMCKDFHSQLDGKNAIISMFKDEDTRKCISGYTNA